MGIPAYGDQRAKGVITTPPKIVLLSLLMAMVLSGSLYAIGMSYRNGTWVVWGCILVVILLCIKEFPLWRLMLPVMPYIAWLCFYLIWGVIVSPRTDIATASKVLVTTLILALCMSILTAKPNHLRTLANYAQLAVVANLLLWVLIPWSSKVALLMTTMAKQSDPDFSGFIRYGGMLGNANMLGYICLVATILSLLASPLVGWVGRLSCPPLLYLTASRKSAVLYIVILFLYVAIVKRRDIKFWMIALTLVISSAMIFMLNDGLRAKSHAVSENQAISRLMDLQEKDTAEGGGMTRIDLLHHWLSALRAAPWYGYGFQAMAGTIYDEDHPEKVLVKGPYPMGAHNTYLGVWVDIGPVGFIAFILMMLHYARLCLFTESDPNTKWVLVSFMVVNLTFLLVSHSHLFSFEGKATFTLFFLLPTCIGLKGLGEMLADKSGSKYLGI
jgi:O-antigen ligase